MLSLSACKLFDKLSAAELNTLRGLCSVESVPAGREIFREGDPGNAVYVIRAGSVEISTRIGSEKAQVVSKLGPGDFFGEMAVIEFKPRSATAIAAEPVVVYRIPAGEMLTLIQYTPDIAVKLMREISHRLREFNLRHVQEISQAERLSLVGRFARSIVHDLKNPLNVIGLTAELAAAENASLEMRQQSRDRILEQVTLINDLVGEILEFTQRGGAATVLLPQDYGTFVRDAARELQVQLELAGVAIHLENEPPSMPILVNPARLRRVFHNLMHNAAQAMPNGGIIMLRFTLKDAQVLTEIEDTGPGIAPEILRRLFEPFATFGKQNGTGLGLSICKRIIEDHHGRIWAESKSGRGAIFVFSLPRPPQ
jgi:signal transduction histidine kinase